MAKTVKEFVQIETVIFGLEKINVYSENEKIFSGAPISIPEFLENKKVIHSKYENKVSDYFI